MAGQGSGCRLENSTASICSQYLPPPGVIGGQCGKQEALLPSRCDDRALFDACKAAPGIAAICYSDTGPAQCVAASELAQTGQKLCPGHTEKCTI
jgi:hypothetical protein